LTITKGGEPASYDLEGIAMRPQGGWWLVTGGAEDFGAAELTKNLLIRVNLDGSMAEEAAMRRDFPPSTTSRGTTAGLQRPG
jgi:hypothetical protein